MIIKRSIGFVFSVLLATIVEAPALTNCLADAEISTMLRERIDESNMEVGIVVGIVDERGCRVFSYGKMKKGGIEDVNGDTLFEIGSITKVFTALLLEDMVDHGELRLDDRIGKFLPMTVKTPSYKGKEITLVDLATHTSGLPDVPFSSWHMLLHHKDPYAGFGEKELYKYLARCKIHEEIGTKFEYSNLGMELLGQVLSLKAGTNYESLVLKRICGPLKMNSTRITIPTDLQARFATGHDQSGRPVNLWSAPLPGDGALRSSVNDLLKFLSAQMGMNHSVLSEAMIKTQVPRHKAGDYEEVALGWIVDKRSGLIWHNGGTSGFCSWISFDKKARSGAVVLANSENDVDDFGKMLSGHMNADAYSRRGVAREVLGDFSGALSDYNKVIELKPADSDWERLYVHTLLWRLGRRSEDFSRTLAGCKAAWPKTIARYLVGQLDEAGFLVAAAKKNNGETVPEQKALAFYYIGIVHLSKGDKAVARDSFRKSRVAALKGDDEYEFAGAELARLDAGAPR